MERPEQQVLHYYPLAIPHFNERRQQWQIVQETPAEPISKFRDTVEEAWDNALEGCKLV